MDQTRCYDVSKLNDEIILKTLSEVKKILEERGYNANNQIVVSGQIEALDILKGRLKEKNIRNVILNVPAPFHSSIMKPASDKLCAELKRYNYNSIQIPVISNISGEFYASSGDIIKNLSMQVFKPVQWVQSIKKACEQGVNLFVEVGPNKVLKNLNKNICKNIKTLALDVMEDLQELNYIQGEFNE